MPRDKNLLKDLFLNKTSNLKYICRKHFPDRHLSTVTKRVNKLFTEGYINKIGIHDRGIYEKVYSVTPQGLQAIRTDFPRKLIRKECQSINLEHDLELTDIREKFLTSDSVGVIKSENELQSFEIDQGIDIYGPFQRLNSDIYFTLLTNGKEFNVASEYENTPKELKRWSKYLLNYHLENKVDAVFYICRNHVIAKSLMNLERELIKSFTPKIYFCTLEKFKSNDGSVDFENARGKKFTFNFQQ